MKTAIANFRLKLKRINHIKYGHDYTTSTKIDTLRSEKHLASNNEFIYTIYLRKCKYRLIFQDAGVETRDLLNKVK